MDYVFAHALEIMYLCVGVGFFLVCIFAVRTLWIATRLMSKLDDLSDIFIEYIQKPLRFIIQAQQILSKVFDWMKK
ncbi:hypothetical protein K9L27_03995 [Candidatus Gracilibacteria bacterium]|nr:hypothetical protein [Candidatus Gracilibacteria bacterium]